MARIRTIKPEFWIDDVIVELDFATRLLFIGIWNFVDDEGFIEDKPKRLKMQIFPADDVLIEDSLSALVKAGRLHEYTSNEGALLRVANWERHQRINRPTPTRFREITPENRRGSVSAPAHFSERSSTEGKGKERKGREGRGKLSESSLSTTPFCENHPQGTEKPCRACQQARQVFDASKKHAEVLSLRPPQVSELYCPDHYGYPAGQCSKCEEVAL